MEEKMITKNASAVCPGSGVPDDEALSLISRYARNTPDANDIYTFSVILCDNEIDRDNERFSVESLTVLKDMFEGVTGIFDHSMRSSDQTARIYKTEILRDESKTTAAGEVYTYIKAWCYMLRTEKNNQLISEIDCGIKKEVSISCSVENKICSVCGKDIRSHDCNHIAGRKSGKTKCHVILENPTDAYEWSFVAVPAQRNAGVSKSVAKKDICTEKDFVQKLSHMFGTVFDEQPEADTLSAFGIMLGKMKEDAMVGKAKRTEAEKEILALSAFTLPESDPAMMSSVLSKISTDEVMMLHKAFGDRAEKLESYTPGFVPEKTKNTNDNSQFRI